MKNLFETGLLAICFFNSMADAKDLRCGGGDGPHPVENFSYKTEVIDTKGGLKEFNFLANKNSAFYKSASRELVRADLAKYSTSKPLAFLGADTVASVADPNERFVAIEGKWKVWEADAGRWLSPANVPSGAEHPTLLYWNAEYLYGVVITTNSMETVKKFTFYRFSTRTRALESLMSLKDHPKNPLWLVQGQIFPNVHFYSNLLMSDGQSLLSTYQYHVITGEKLSKGEGLATLRSPLKSIHYFTKLNAYAVHVEHERENLLWATGDNTCRYFNIGPFSPIVPNYEIPMLVTWQALKGITLISLNGTDKPEDARQAALIPELPILNLRARDVVLTNNRQMLIAPQFPQESTRWLFQIKLGNLSESF